MDEPSATALTAGLRRLVTSIRDEVGPGRDPAESSRAVARHLERALEDPDLLAPVHREAGETDYTQHILHVEPDGSFSVVSLVWLPGQQTPVHDHVAWCVPGIYRGREEETRYRLEGAAREEATAGRQARDSWASPGDGRDDGGPHLVEVGRETNDPGTVVTLTPPGDIHHVRNPGPEKAVSVHVYGADIGELGSSIRRTYDLPVRPES